MLFLCDPHLSIDELLRDFPAQVARYWLPHDEVRSVLEECDHGLLVRYPCVTNRVASPTKFAEYLSAGLPVIISEGVGDFSALVGQQDLGRVTAAGIPEGLGRTSQAERRRLERFAGTHLTKEAHDLSYRALLCHLTGEAVEWVDTQGPATDPLVSIIVPSFNKGRYVEEMVASVQAQSHHNWEMLFIDDGSTDETRIILTRMARTDERIKLHFQVGNHGANRCRNLGIQLAVGDHVMFLDADDVLAPYC
jgi:hypothetical protein